MRNSARVTGAAVALATALLVSGCGSGDGDGDKAGRTPAERPAQDGGGAGSAPLRGGWGRGEITDKDHLVLVFNEDKALLSGSDVSCSGTFAENADPVTVDLACVKGDGYGRGTVQSNDGEKLTIAWESGSTDTFVKLTGPSGKPPEGVPGLDR